MLSTRKIQTVKKILIALVVLVAAATAVNLFAAPEPATGQPGKSADHTAAVQPPRTGGNSGLIYIAVALCVGFSSLAAGWAVSTVGAAAMGAISEKPELAGRALIFVGLAEGIAIYGLIVAIMLLGKA